MAPDEILTRRRAAVAAHRLGEPSPLTFHLGAALSAYIFALLAAPLGVRGVRTVLAGTTGRDLVPVLTSTGVFEVAYALLVAVGVALARA